MAKKLSKKALIKDMFRLYTEPKVETDFTIESRDGDKFNVHSYILALRYPGRDPITSNIKLFCT